MGRFARRSREPCSNESAPAPLLLPRQLQFRGHLPAATALSAAAYAFSMPPWGLWPLGFFALVPLTLTALSAPRRRALLAAYGFGFAVFLFLTWWILYVTLAGWIALAAYLAVYPLAFIILLRWLRRRLDWPLMILAPVAWTALEYLRGTLISGFPWFFLGHSQQNDPPLMQLADIGGVYGISFALAMVSGALVDVVMGRLGLWGRTACVLAAAGAFIYGEARLAECRTEPGPRVALIQGNVPMSLKHAADEKSAAEVLDDYVSLSLRPETAGVDLVIWPETMMPCPLNLFWIPEARSYVANHLVAHRAGLEQIARHTGARLLIGSESYDPVTEYRYNSVHYISPELKPLGRYDKIHLVPFGEYTPLPQLLPFVEKYRDQLMGPGLRPGRAYTRFDLPWNGDQLRFSVNICYEDSEPRVARRLSQGADFLVNVSNDAWFQGSVELDQHLAVSRFRAVENRLGMVKAYNSGISAIIDPAGRVRDCLSVNGRHREVEGVLVGEVPLARMYSFYREYGDVFAWLCLAALAALGALAVIGRKRRGQ